MISKRKNSNWHADPTGGSRPKHICDICGKEYKDKYILAKHRKVHTEPQSFECDICATIFNSPGARRRHKIRKHTSEKKFVCDICGYAFHTKDQLTGHLKVHSSERPHRCSVCGKGFLAPYMLARHMLTHSNERTFKCDICGKSFKSNGGFHNHRKIHSDDPPFKSEICGATFNSSRAQKNHRTLKHDTTEKSFERDFHHDREHHDHICEICDRKCTSKFTLTCHLRTHTGERPFECDVCHKTFARSDKLRNHKIKNHTQEKNFKCPECEKKFYLRTQLTQHLKIHKLKRNVGRSHKCPICEKVCKYKSTLAKHLKRHTDERGYICDICGASYKSSSGLHMHRQIHTSVEPKPYECDQCNTRFTQKYSLSVHKKTRCPLNSNSGMHQKERLDSDKSNEPLFNNSYAVPSGGSRPKHICDVCGHGYTTKTYLRRHRKTHSETQSFECDICGKVCKTPCTLRRHKIIKHTSEKKFACNVCGKAFQMNRQLTDHLQVHSSERPHQCPECGKTFRARRLLAQHTPTHSDERPFECDICGAGFKSRNVLLKHRKTHTSVYMCDICGASYKSHSGLDRHRKIHTSVGPKPYECDLCSSRFWEKGILNSHKKRRCPSRPNRPNESSILKTRNDGRSSPVEEDKLGQYKCDICGAAHKSPSGLAFHIYSSHNIHDASGDPKPYKCDLCSSQFVKQSSLSAHRKKHLKERNGNWHADPTGREQRNGTHTGKRPFQCDLCHKSYNRRGELNLHRIKNHTQEKNVECPECGGREYMCDICGASYTTDSGLRFHRNMHTYVEPKPYKCDQCNTGFTQKGSLNFHKQHRCPSGSISQIYKENLARHKFHCRACGKDCRTKEQLEEHRKSEHSPERPHKCDICGKGFTFYSSLDKHSRDHANEQQQQPKVPKKRKTSSKVDTPTTATSHP
ncbi:zinc finger protein 208-like [Sabethes cyaneus]|uniref:zinc finger protein 208-like n=1 Tax=Sabethes cyaneus TaxID=53552 RepID=UPI00237E86A3|nr:zinc finger protein 208-like [Sabethes cyaneus]